MNKEEYRAIIDVYFRAFGTGDFTNVGFSPSVEFLSPLSSTTIKSREAVTTFIHNVTTRVAKVAVLSITVDPPTASGVWQMETSKGRLYTLHNFFRLDDQGIVYIWPMFDPKAVMEDPKGLIQWLTGEGY